MLTGLPCAGHGALHSRSAKNSALGATARVRHKATERRDGASKLTWYPVTMRVAMSIAKVTQGRPMGLRSKLSTRMMSAGV